MRIRKLKQKPFDPAYTDQLAASLLDVPVSEWENQPESTRIPNETDMHRDIWQMQHEIHKAIASQQRQQILLAPLDPSIPMRRPA